MVARVLWVFLLVFALAWHREAGAQPARSQETGSQAQPTPRVLGAEQLAKVKAVLAPYTASALTAGDAKAIKRALRDAGMRPSPELDAALRSQGFSPERLDELDPRPPGPPGAGEAEGKGPPPAPRKSSSPGSSTK